MTTAREEMSVGWYDHAWRKRKRVVLQRARISGELEGFPLLVALDDDADITAHARTDGRDILFTAADGVTKLPHDRVVHQKMLREQAVWTIWSDPRAIRHVGERDRTYISYYTRNQGWWISALDHTTGEWEHVQLREHAASADGRWWDDHNNPALTIRDDGRIVAVYGEHSTDRSWCRISTQPEDIGEWGPEIPFEQEQAVLRRGRWVRRASRLFGRGYRATRRLLRLPVAAPKARDEPAYSYVNLYTLPDGTLWRQYRPLTTWSGRSRRPTFVTSDDGGETWSRPVRFLEQKRRTPYLVTARAGHRIHFFFTDAHPDEWPHTSVYHAYYDHSDGTYRRSDGSIIGDGAALPFTPADATRVFDGTSTAGEAWVHHFAADEGGGLAGVFTVYGGGSEGLESYRVHEYWYARWTGSGWTTSRMAAERDRFCSGQLRYTGGVVVDSEDVDTVYVSLVDPEGSSGSHSRHLWRYATRDDGRTWTRQRVSRGGQGRAHSRPVVPINRHPDLPVVWLYGDYVNYFDYRTSLVAGDHGVHLESRHYVRVPRLRPDADLVLYVYYDNHEDGDQAAVPNDVWPTTCRLAYRGTLTQNDVRVDPFEEGGSVTLELGATWASDRRGGGAAPILSTRSADGVGLIVSKGADQSIEMEVSGDGPDLTQAFDDLTMPRRPWREAYEPVRVAAIQILLGEDGAARAWLDGRESGRTGRMRASPLGGTTLRVGYSPDRPGVRFEGWVEWLRIYGTALDQAWLALSARADASAGRLVELGPEESVSHPAPGPEGVG